MKICTKCKQEKSLDDFSKNKNTKDNLDCWCKQCKAIYKKEYRQNNKIKIKEYNDKYNKEHEEQIKEYKKGYYYTKSGNISHKNSAKKYRDSHKEERKEYQNIYRKTEIGKESRRKSDLKRKDKRAEYKRNRIKNDINYRILCNLRLRVWQSLNNNVKSKSTQDLLGCTIEQFKEYIEYRFEDDMMWNNYGKVWELDHYIPCSYFNLSDLEQQKICFHLLNIRPYCKNKNRSKQDILPEDYLEIIEEIKFWINENNKM